VRSIRLGSEDTVGHVKSRRQKKTDEEVVGRRMRRSRRRARQQTKNKQNTQRRPGEEVSKGGLVEANNCFFLRLSPFFYSVSF